MAEKPKSFADRYAATLYSLLEDNEKRPPMSKAKQKATRDAVVSWMSGLNKKTLIETLLKLYATADRDARKRSHGKAGIIRRIADRISARIHLR